MSALFENIPLEQLPYVNILIANYNYSEYLPDAIKSAFGQDYKKFGVIIVDDASEDESWNVIHQEIFKGIQHEKKSTETFDIKTGSYNGIKVTAIKLHKNVGPSEARNIAIEYTIQNTDFYQILDADDVMHGQKVSTLVMHMLMSPSIGVAYADYDIVNTDTNVVTREYKEPFSRDRLLEECIVHSGAMVNRQALLAVKDQFGYYDREMRTCEDYDLWVRISEKFAIIHVPEPLTLVRVQPKNSTATVDNSIWQKNWQRIGQKLQMRYVK